MIIKINNTEIKEYTLKRLSLKSAYNKHTELEIELEILDIQQLSLIHISEPTRPY